jgi:two-component sensor histidine kinase
LQAVQQRQLQREKEDAERQVRVARDRAELLLREVNHRVANSLQLVSSLVSMQTAAVSDAAARDALTETQGRIAAIGQIHRRLYTSDDVRFVEVGTYLEGLIEELRGALQGDGRVHEITVDTEELLLPTDQAVSLGMIVTELLTNAYKYAYPDGKSGPIRVTLKPGDGCHVLCVEDEGIGWNGQGGSATGTGLGTKIIHSMARALGGPMEFDSEHRGTRVMLRIAQS